jgi:predicted nucleotidyltransferase
MVNNVTIDRKHKKKGLKQRENSRKYLSLVPLLYSKDDIHLAELSRILNIPHVTLRLYYNEFEKQGFLIKKIRGRLTTYKINYNIPNIIDLITIVEKEKVLYRCKNLILKEIVNFLHNFSKEVIIFGSAVSSDKYEDIDILVSGKINKEEMKYFEKRIGKRFHVINSDIENIKLALKEEIIKNHLIINNSETIIKWMLS